MTARLGEREREALVQKLAQFGGSGAIQPMLAATAAPSTSPAARSLALQAMALTRVKELPEAVAGAAGRRAHQRRSRHRRVGRGGRANGSGAEIGARPS